MLKGRWCPRGEVVTPALSALWETRTQASLGTWTLELCRSPLSREMKTALHSSALFGPAAPWKMHPAMLGDSGYCLQKQMVSRNSTTPLVDAISTGHGSAAAPLRTKRNVCGICTKNMMHTGTHSTGASRKPSRRASAFTIFNSPCSVFVPLQ